MKVRLVTHTVGAAGTEFAGKTLDELIAQIARVSSTTEQNERHKKADTLIRYMIAHGHWSPFEQVDLTFEIITSRAIGRQMIRHKSLSVQEFSQRYAQVTELEDFELREQAAKNRQSSSARIENSQLELVKENALEHALAAYEILLENGVAKESARFVLPESAQTTLFFKGGIRQWVTFLNERLYKDAQLEIQLIAQLIRDVLLQHVPIICAALFNFEHADQCKILDQVLLDRLGLREIALQNEFKRFTSDQISAMSKVL